MTLTTHHSRQEALAERLFANLLGGMELLTIELGRRLGLYETLHRLGPSTPAELATAAGIHQRYAREWLEQQAVADLLDVVTPDEDAGARRYALPDEHVPVLIEPEDPAYLMAAAPSLRAVAVPIPDVAEAYRTGAGVAYRDYGEDLRDAIAAFNRPMFTNDMGRWIAAMPDVAARLDQPGGTVLDVGCGSGWSTLGLASALPNATVVGVDMDEASIQQARNHAEHVGASHRVTFTAGDAAAGFVGTGYALACIFEALHDMGDPVGALRSTRQVLAADGVLLVADERVAEQFTAPGDEIERFMYGWSTLHCLPATMAESPVTANGTVLRKSTLRRWAQEAGFRGLEVLDIENDFWRFYRLDV